MEIRCINLSSSSLDHLLAMPKAKIGGIPGNAIPLSPLRIRRDCRPLTACSASGRQPTALDELRRSLADQVLRQRTELWGGNLEARRDWMERGGRSAALKGGWQDEYAGLLAIVADVSRRKVSFSPAEADRIVAAARQRHGPDSLEFGRALGASGIALLACLAPGWQRSAPMLLAQAHRVHEAWLGPRHCSVFMLGAFRAAAEAVANSPRRLLYTEVAAKARLDAAIEAGGPSGPQLGEALAEAGLALMVAGHSKAGGAMLVRAAAVLGDIHGSASHPIPSICRALCNDPLLWGGLSMRGVSRR